MDRGRRLWQTSSQVDDATLPHMRRTIARRLDFVRRNIETWRDQSGVERPFRLLDAGCGDGVVLMELVKMDGAECRGVDCSSLRADRARRNVPEADIEVGDLREIVLEDESLGCIVMMHVLEHIREDDEVLGRLSKALRIGGLFILGVPNEGCMLGRIRNYILNPSIGKTTDHVNFYTERNIRQKLSGSGFRIVSMARENFMYPRQEIAMLVMSCGWGYWLSQFLGRIAKSQAGGLLFACQRMY